MDGRSWKQLHFCARANCSLWQLFDGDRYGGLITSYDGVYYHVRYPKDGDEEELSDNDFDGSDIEFLPVEGGSGAEDADSETDSISGLKDPDAAIEEGNSDQSEDEDGILATSAIL